MRRKTKKPTMTKSQRERFIEAAREHGASEDAEAFERVFAEIVPPKTGKPSPSEKKGRGPKASGSSPRR